MQKDKTNTEEDYKTAISTFELPQAFLPNY
jgi:hypothetical protein